MQDQGVEIKKVLVTNLKHQMQIFEDIFKRLQKLQQLGSQGPQQAQQYDLVEKALSKWRILSSQNYLLIQKYANSNSSVQNVKMYQKMEICVCTQRYIQKCIDQAGDKKWPTSIQTQFAKWVALQYKGCNIENIILYLVLFESYFEYIYQRLSNMYKHHLLKNKVYNESIQYSVFLIDSYRIDVH